ncbi:MAG: transposase [Actinomycetia bacterium]|nr:transposase [Actinomycetes bacterium]
MAKDEQIASLTASLEAALERIRRMELRIAELERRLNMDSSDSGTPSSRESIGAKEARKARQRQESEGERSKDRLRGGQPGHKGKGPQRDPDPGERKTAAPPAECRSCRASLDGAAPAAEPRWAQSVDVRILREVTEFLLPGLACPCCGEVTFAQALPACTPARCPTGRC